MIFYLQLHESSNLNGFASMLLTENLPQSNGTSKSTITTDDPVTIIQQLDSLDRPHNLCRCDPSEQFEVWGSIQSTANPHDHHSIFCDHVDKCITTQSLYDAFQGEAIRSCISYTQILQISRIVTTSHIYFASVRPGCVKARRYKVPPLQIINDEETWNDGEPLELRPYLSTGFGQNPPREKIGATSSVGKAHNSSLIEVEHTMCQIGTRMNVDYGTGRAGLMKARAQIMNSLGALDRSVGSLHTDIVQMCLESTNPKLLPKADDENVVMEGIILFFVEYEDRLGQAMICHNSCTNP